MDEEALKKFQMAVRQFEEGAITFIEFHRYCRTLVTREMVEEHNKYHEGANSDMFKADWPFIA